VPLSLVPKPAPTPEELAVTIGNLVPGTIVQVTDQLTSDTQENWLRLKICSVPAEGQALPEAVLKPGTEGWQTLTAIALAVTPPPPLTAAQMGTCVSSIAPAPSPTVAPPSDSPTPLPSPPNQAQ
jgi:hypothetical protein